MKMDEKQSENKSTLASKILCTACLCVGRTLHDLNDGKVKKYYMDTISEIPLHNNLRLLNFRVCWECNCMFRKAVLFREQVKDSFRILQTYTHESLHECLLSEVTRPGRFDVHKNEPINIEPKVLDNDEEPKEILVVSIDESKDIEDNFDVDTGCEKLYTDDIKSEPLPSECSNGPTSDRIDSDDCALDMIVKKKKKKRAVNKKALKKEGSMKRNIIVVDLTYEQLMEERAVEKTRSSYLNAPYKCETCIIGFSYNRSYKAHQNTRHASNLGNYTCPICSAVVATIESFTAHYKRHLKRYVCGICGKRTLDLKVMKQHYFTNHETNAKEYTCQICGKISYSLDSHRYHKDTHKARVQCPECDKTFSHRAGLMNHKLAVHEAQNQFTCTLCSKTFKWKTSLKRHIEQHDLKKTRSRTDPYCSTCGITFANASSYQRHMKNSLKHVTPERFRLICDVCKKRFVDKTKLRDHIEEKHMHRTYQCHICLKRSNSRTGLDQHIRNVHKGRPHNKICQYCGKGFPTKLQLESHIRTHTGERPFICEYCPTTFSQQSNLYKHNRQVHLNIKSKRYPLCKKSKPSAMVGDHLGPLQSESNMETYKPVLEFTGDRGFVM